MTDILQTIASELYEGEDESVAELVQQALDQGLQGRRPVCA
jgi:methanogenic corrinoid protein MtbC1